MRTTLFIAIMMILLSASVCALTATTISGMILMKLESVPTTFEKSVGVKNENNQTAIVKFTPSPEIADAIVMEAYNITLEPNETKFVKFNLTVTKMEKLTGSIMINFEDPTLPANQSQDQFAVSTSLVVLPASPNAGNTTGQAENLSGNTTSGVNTSQGGDEQPGDEPVKGGFSIFLVALAVLASAIVILIIIKRKGAKNE